MKDRIKQINELVTNQLTKDNFIKELIGKDIADFNSSDTRKIFKIKNYNIQISKNGKSFGNWADFNRLPNSTGYESGLVWIDHDRNFTTGRLIFSGKLIRNYVSSDYLKVGSTSHHRTQHCNLIPWSKLQLIPDSHLEEIVYGWTQYINNFFRN